MSCKCLSLNKLASVRQDRDLTGLGPGFDRISTEIRPNWTRQDYDRIDCLVRKDDILRQKNRAEILFPAPLKEFNASLDYPDNLQS